jgi:F420-non-reducing hydrogenase small subunit
MAKPKLALYWASSCGGCEIAVVRIYEKILDVANFFEIVLWPCLMDFKYKDVEGLPAGSIDLCLFNGAIRTSEQEEMAQMLREKSKVMVAFGACANLGGIPGLANVTSRGPIFRCVYRETPSTVNEAGVYPQSIYSAPEGELTLPAFHDTVRPLHHVVPVEYFVPGCPPVKEQVEAVLQAVMEGNLPPVGSVVGASIKTVCQECPRVKEEKKITAFRRTYEFQPDPERCLLEQGILCAGPATRGGCGVPCLDANMPCRGCYGPPPGVVDQGAKLLSAVASIVDSEDMEEIERVVAGIPDTVAGFYMFGLAASLLRRRRLTEPAPEDPTPPSTSEEPAQPPTPDEPDQPPTPEKEQLVTAS